MEDSRIVDLYLARDESAIKHSAEKYGARLHGISLGIVNDPRTAEECENDVYSEAWRLIPPNEPRDYLFASLARIARSLSLKRCRSERALKRSAYITELSHEMQECVPSGVSVEAQADCTLLGEAISRFLLFSAAGEAGAFHQAVLVSRQHIGSRRELRLQRKQGQGHSVAPAGTA